MTTNPFKNAIEVGDNIDPQVYHRRDPKIPRGHPEYQMSRSELMEFAFNPLRWKEGVPEEQSDSMKWGDMMDCQLLTPKLFAKKYQLAPSTYINSKREQVPWTLKSQTCRDVVAEQRKQGIELIDTKTAIELKAASKMFERDARLSELVACSRSQVMIVSEYHDAATGLVVPMKILLDLVPDPANETFGKSLADLKTARSAELRAWESAVFEHDYHIQGAIYYDVYCAAHPDEDRTDWRFAIQENTKPYVTGRRILSMEFMQIGRDAYRSALKDYCVCLKTGVWPGYDDHGTKGYQGWNFIEPRPWMAEGGFGMGLKMPQAERPAQEERFDLH